MGLLNWLGYEKRASSIDVSDPYLGEFLGQRSGLSGHVNNDRASGIATAQACISTVSQALASLPLNLYSKTANGGREKHHEHPLFGVLHDMANPSQTSFEVRETMIANLMVTGNAFAQLQWNEKGQVTALYPIDNGHISMERMNGGRLRYRVANQRGQESIFLQEEILHLRYRLSKDGDMGLSPIALARETFALALSQNDTAIGMSEKAFRPSGAFVFPGSLTDEQYERVRKTFGNLGGSEHAGKVLVLDGDVKFNRISMSAADAEFLESRKLSNLDICRIWNVPPTAAGIVDNATYSNTDQESRALVIRCLAPMAKRIEQAMNAALLPELSRTSMFIEHDLAGLLRGDMKARYEGYRIGREWGWLSPNEIRSFENLPEIDEGDEYLSPLNMAQMGKRDDQANKKGEND